MKCLILARFAGALNLTREAYTRAQLVKSVNAKTEEIIADAERSCKKTDSIMSKYSDQFTKGLQENDNNLQKLSKDMSLLEVQIPSLNKKVILFMWIHL